MHTRETVNAALDLAASGADSIEIGAQLGIPSSTIRGWLRGHLPRITDPSPNSCDGCGGCHDLPSLGAPYAHLLGLYLGDGCIATHPRGVYKLRLALDARYPRIIRGASASIEAVRARPAATRLTPNNYIEVYSYWKQWPCHFPQHGPGLKHLRPIFLADWQQQIAERWPEQLLRGLIESDGCRFISTGRRWSNPRYTFFNKSTGVTDIFRAACDLLGLHWTESKPYTTYVSRKADVARMDSFIGPKR